MKIHKLRAVTEDPSAPFLDCYDQNDPNAIAILAVARTTITPPPTKAKHMSLNPVNITAEKRSKVPMPGIGHGSPARLLDTLSRLGLCSNEMATPLKSISAAGHPINHLFTVSVHELDRALEGVECKVADRINFKNALSNLGILTVPR